MTVVAVVGLSGVGKSTLLSEMSKRHAFLHLQASQLIKSEQQKREDTPLTSEQLRLGPVLDNQDLLVSGLERAVQGYSGLVVFDGHVLIDTDLAIIEIPSSIFARIGCRHLIVLTDSPDRLGRRRVSDALRSRPPRSAAMLRQHQVRMVEIAETIAGDLGIPFTKLNIDDRDGFEALLQSFH